MKFFKRIQEAMQPSKQEIPTFTNTEIIRYHYTFHGIVQNVGFRVELWKIANQLKLTGWVKNKPDGSVECEIQGTQDKIDYTIQTLENIPRIHIEEMKKNRIEMKEENTFELHY